MSAVNYRKMSIDELEDQIDQLRTELFNLRLGNVTKELQDTAKIGLAKRELARVLTVLSEKSKQETAAG